MIIFPRKLLFIIITLIILLSGLSNACVGKFKEVKRSQSLWDSMTFTRDLHSSRCVCGIHDPSKTDKYPWSIFVHTTIPPESSSKTRTRTCPGSIINSNTVVTSHKCLLLQKRMRVVDILKFKNGEKSIARPQHVTVTTEKNGKGTNFEVIDIWYNPHFARSSEENQKHPENDLVLIKVKADFISEMGVTPVCVPFYDEMAEDKDFMINLKGYFYGYAEDAGLTDPSWHKIEGQIVKKSVCFKKREKNEHELEENSFEKTLCLKFVDKAKRKNLGGPLITTWPASGKMSAFILGISTDIGDPKMDTGRDASLGKSYAYFSWINPVVKFIEYFSKVRGQESSWCETPPFKLENSRAKILDDEELPWENLDEPIVRDESLNCVCGVDNTKLSGRIAGGVETTPREFGWMALLYFYPQGRGHAGSYCGGTIINDRVILTASHCVVPDSWLKEGRSVDPENVDVILNAHFRRNDPNAIRKEVSAVLFHPKYVDGRNAEPFFYDSDVALLILKDPLKFPKNSKGLRPVCLFKMGDYVKVIGKTATAVGWGLKDPTNDNSKAEKLQKVELPIAELSLCRDVARSKVTDNNICAGTLNQFIDAAKGDSGGPLQIEENGQWYEVAAVSWADFITRGGTTLTAALYADVQKLVPFIDYHSERVEAKWCRSK